MAEKTAGTDEQARRRGWITEACTAQAGEHADELPDTELFEFDIQLTDEDIGA